MSANMYGSRVHEAAFPHAYTRGCLARARVSLSPICRQGGGTGGVTVNKTDWGRSEVRKEEREGEKKEARTVRGW